MRFRTEIKIPESGLSLCGAERILLMGSCFTDNIGGKLRDAQWRVCVNPCGVQYNPASIARLMEVALGVDEVEDLFFCHGGLWRNWLLPSQFAEREKSDAVAKSEGAVRELREALKHSEVIVVTFGTAWVYSHRRGDGSRYEGVVGNCHKVPSVEFERRRLDVAEIVEEWTGVIKRIREVNPGAKMIFTVSPIRHVKDGLHGNAVSKSILLLAADELCRLADDVYYFPAFEIVNDDLRDYRFYAADMVHPSDVAVDYIWGKFRQAYMSTEAERMTDAGEKLHRRLVHRVMSEGAEADAFAAETDAMRRDFLERYPWLR